jgi:CubicO group peptidase (beta-lactamase class C family)
VAWGQVERRFMCHSVRKSLLSALYGINKDDIDLELTLAELGIDDVPPLTQQEKQARVVDLIRSRSGVYHEAAAEPEAMSRNRPARGSYNPGAHWWYNNWDFNAAGVVFEQQTGKGIFEAFAEAIAQPIDMQDYRVSDGFYHDKRDKSIHPGYMFRMSTRDLARFGLLYARGGRWKDKQIIPETWMEESTKPHSKVDMGSKYGSGYGYVWWIEGTQGYTARGSGGHILAVYPASDLVMAIRADTYHGRLVSTRACMRLFNMVAEARRGGPVKRCVKGIRRPPYSRR